jgi:hypothetical protein
MVCCRPLTPLAVTPAQLLDISAQQMFALQQAYARCAPPPRVHYVPCKPGGVCVVSVALVTMRVACADCADCVTAIARYIAGASCSVAVGHHFHRARACMCREGGARACCRATGVRDDARSQRSCWPLRACACDVRTRVRASHAACAGIVLLLLAGGVSCADGGPSRCVCHTLIPL